MEHTRVENWLAEEPGCQRTSRYTYKNHPGMPCANISGSEYFLTVRGTQFQQNSLNDKRTFYDLFNLFNQHPYRPHRLCLYLEDGSASSEDNQCEG